MCNGPARKKEAGPHTGDGVDQRRHAESNGIHLAHIPVRGYSGCIRAGGAQGAGYKKDRDQILRKKQHARGRMNT